MDLVSSMLKSGNVVKVRVLRIPDTVTTVVSVTPDALRSEPYYSVTFNEDLSVIFESLLSGIRIKKDDHIPDIRWGLLLFDAKDHEIGSLFVDKFGQHGYLNGENVSFETGFFDANVAKRLHKIIGNLR